MYLHKVVAKYKNVKKAVKILAKVWFYDMIYIIEIVMIKQFVNCHKWDSMTRKEGIKVTMKVADFNYNLPEELIAQVPIENRDTSRLMVLDRKTKTIDHKIFKDILDYLEPGDCLVRNNTKVIPARLYGIKKETGIAVEFLLLNRIESKKQNESGKNEEIWEVMVRPRKTFKTGDKSNLWRRFIKSRNIRYHGWWK